MKMSCPINVDDGWAVSTDVLRAHHSLVFMGTVSWQWMDGSRAKKIHCHVRRGVIHETYLIFVQHDGFSIPSDHERHRHERPIAVPVQ